MGKKTTAKKTVRGRGRPKNDTPKPSEIKEVKDFGTEIISLHMKNPRRTNVSIASEIGCDEKTVRNYLNPNGKYRQKVEKAIRDYYSKTIFAIQNKAFKVLEELLDDPNTSDSVRLSACKFMLEKYLMQRDEQSTETIEFETIISDSGTLSQIKRKIYETKNSKEDCHEKWEDLSMGSEPGDGIQIQRKT